MGIPSFNQCERVVVFFGAFFPFLLEPNVPNIHIHTVYEEVFILSFLVWCYVSQIGLPTALELILLINAPEES